MFSAMAVLLATFIFIACSPLAPVTPSPTKGVPVTPFPPASTKGSASPSSLAGNISGEDAYRLVQALAVKVGSRPAGSEAVKEASIYIAQQFQDGGYQVQKQGFSFRQYLDEGAEATVLSSPPKELHPNTLFYSLGGEGEGEVVAAGIGEDKDTQGVKGKIALVERGVLRFSEKVENAARAGAVAVIVYNNQAGNFRGSLGSLSRIPAVALSQEEGEALLSALGQSPVRVRLVVKGHIQEGEGLNVIAKKDVTKPCRWLLGAHYDSVAAGPGANDNASGVAVVLEVARRAAFAPWASGLCFVAFDVEELGLFGSRHYVDSLSPRERQAMEVMVNLDMVGVGDSWGLAGTSEMVALGQAVAEEWRVAAQEFRLAPELSSDHASFQAASIPVLFIHLREDPRYHTAEDKAEYVRPEHLQTAGRIALGVVERLAQGGSRQ
ncbi:MAG: M28 family peptidase [Chloroflexi bacterium]|nr:M28 family peptidase [Chloroflexota bacterium]